MAELDIRALNAAMKNPEAAVAEAERLYSEKINEVADRVVFSDNIRLVLLSGPSGSGKTTTANLLCDRIKAMGEKCVVISLDNFYRNSTDKHYPTLPDGSPDFESPYALDIDFLMKTLKNIVSTNPFEVPRYDFKTGERVEILSFDSFSHGCAVIEGIHALNPLFSNELPSECVLKLFVSVSTNISDGAVRLISGKKLRFVRRMVRDNIYRGTDAKRTLELWENVLRGEEKYLYPYKETADIKFDTFHIFEPSVMKPYAMKLLTHEIVCSSSYANTVASAMAAVEECSCGIVPETSLIREFIPGGVYEHLY